MQNKSNTNFKFKEYNANIHKYKSETEFDLLSILNTLIRSRDLLVILDKQIIYCIKTMHRHSYIFRNAPMLFICSGHLSCGKGKKANK
jgi:hypothetical protein